MTLGARVPLPFRQTTRYHPKARHQHYGHEYPQIQRHVGGLVVAPRERLPPMTLDRCAASLGAAHLAVPVGLGNGVVSVARTVRATRYRTSNVSRQGMQPRIRRNRKPHPHRTDHDGTYDRSGQQPLSRRPLPPRPLSFFRTQIHRVPFPLPFLPNKRAASCGACGSSKRELSCTGAAD